MSLFLASLKLNLDIFSERFGIGFITRLDHLLDTTDDVTVLQQGINDLFISLGTTYHKATAEASEQRLSSGTDTDQPKRSPNDPTQNEIANIIPPKSPKNNSGRSKKVSRILKKIKKFESDIVRKAERQPGDNSIPPAVESL